MLAYVYCKKPLYINWEAIQRGKHADTHTHSQNYLSGFQELYDYYHFR